MGSPIQVGDVVLLSKIAWQVHQAFKNARGDLQVLSTQALSIHSLLEELEKSFEELYLDKYQRRRLHQHLSQCREALLEVEKIIKRYQSIRDENGKLKILRWQLDSDTIHQAKGRLMDQVNMLTNFNTSITMQSVAKIKNEMYRLDPETAYSRKRCPDQDMNWPQLHESSGVSKVPPEDIVPDMPDKKPPDKSLDQSWRHSGEGWAWGCAFCGRRDHETETCDRMRSFDIEPASSPEPLTIHEDYELPATPPTSLESCSRRHTAPAGSGLKKKTQSWSTIGTETTITAGFAPGSGPQLSIYRPPPSSVSTDSSSSSTSRQPNGSSVATEPAQKKRSSLMSSISSRVSAIGSDSPSIQHGFSR